MQKPKLIISDRERSGLAAMGGETEVFGKRGVSPQMIRNKSSIFFIERWKKWANPQMS